MMTRATHLIRQGRTTLFAMTNWVRVSSHRLMNSRTRLYIMAFAAYTSALLVAAVFAWVALQYSMAAGVAQLAVALSGNEIGGFALLLGILRDDRAQKAEE